MQSSVLPCLRTFSFSYHSFWGIKSSESTPLIFPIVYVHQTLTKHIAFSNFCKPQNTYLMVFYFRNANICYFKHCEVWTVPKAKLTHYDVQCIMSKKNKIDALCTLTCQPNTSFGRSMSNSRTIKNNNILKIKDRAYLLAFHQGTYILIHHHRGSPEMTNSKICYSSATVDVNEIRTR